MKLDADCVLYHAQGDWNPPVALDDICRILASGKNVVSTAVTAWIYPESSTEDVVERLEAACNEGQSSFHGTGIEPGWGSEVLPLTMSGLFRRIDSLLVQELMDYSTYDQPFVLFDVMGFGKPPDTRVPMDEAAIGALSFKAPLMLVAEGLGATIEDYVWERQVATTDKPIEVKAGRIEAGTVSAVRFAYTAIIEGRRALTVEHITRLGPDQAPHWPNGRGWKVTVEGLPSMVLESRIAITMRTTPTRRAWAPRCIRCMRWRQSVRRRPGFEPSSICRRSSAAGCSRKDPIVEARRTRGELGSSPRGFQRQRLPVRRL